MSDQDYFADGKVISPTVKRKWVQDERLLLSWLGSVKRNTVDIWADDIVQILGKLTAEKRPYLTVYDFRDVAMLTPYIRHRGQDIIKAGSEIEGRYALVLQKNLVGRVAMMFVQKDVIPQQNQYEYKFFFEMDSAIKWVSEAIPRYYD